ncbi:MAG: TlpA family protein disulfide reductase [Aureliella sp.]
MQLRFKGGGYVNGTLLPCDKPGYLRLQCSTFDEPLELAIEALSSVEPDEANRRNGLADHLFYLSSGVTLAGTLAELDKEHAVIDSPCLGPIRLPRKMLSRIVAQPALGKLVYSGPRGGTEWSGIAKATDWKYEAGTMVTSQLSATALGYVGLPWESEVRVVLSWSGVPDFTLSLGCARPAQPTDRISAAVSLEVWNEQLVIVRETPDAADIAVLGDLPAEQHRLELIIFVGQDSGVVAVCAPNGRLLGKLKVRGKNPSLKQLIALTQQGESSAGRELRLERCEVRRWDGQLPREWPENNEAVLLEDGQLLAGEFDQLDAERKEIAFVGEDGKRRAIPLEKIRQAVVSRVPEQSIDSAESLEVELADGSYLEGVWKEIDSDQVTFMLNGLDAPIHFSINDLVGVRGRPNDFEASELDGRLGQLDTETAQLIGCLAESDGEGVLRWHVLGAAAPTTVARASSGKIVYSTPRLTPQASSTPQENIRPFQFGVAPQGVVVFRNGRLALQGPAPPPKEKQLEPGLKLRRGDELRGRVERIDERGVTFTSPETSVTFLPHEQIDCVTLVSRRAADSQSPEKLKRLMTVPRASKNDPPTHLLVSVSGDYLRGRLIEFNKQHVVMEVRLEEIELPADRVAEIYWLHRRDWPDAQSSKSEEDSQKDGENQQPAANGPLQVLVLRRGGRPITFVPYLFWDETLHGKNDLLGECQVELANVNEVHFGADLAKSLPTPSDKPWTLSLATLPKVYQPGEYEPGENASPLVGKAAPDFALETATGEKFELRKRQGRVVVLDFWASWCGPCMQTMPEVDRIVHQLGNDQVDLVAVNLQETKEQAQATLKRLGLSATLVLDEDGAVAAQYQATAIPQTVVIDRQGNVTHLFIGGGERVLKAFEESLKSVVDPP